MRLKVAFRCDSSPQIGSGHVMRCLALAEELRGCGAEIFFLCREHEQNLFKLITSSGYQLLRLPLAKQQTDTRLAHAPWLGATQQEDASQTLELLQKHDRMDWLVVDHYAIDREWETLVRPHVHRIMVIDDLADRMHDCDILLDQNYHGDAMEGRYGKLIPQHARALLGPKYALLRREFRGEPDMRRMRDGRIRRILVFFGGGDPANVTGKAIHAFQQLRITNVAVDAIVGAANPHYEELVQLCARQPAINLYRQVDNMAELMAQADLAIGAGGVTMWERCSMGLPSIVLSVAKNQNESCAAVSRLGAILYLGEAQNMSAGLLEHALQLVLSMPEWMSGVSEKARALVDGRGALRVAGRMLASNITLRPAVESDCEPLLKWRNAEETRRYSLDAAPIAFADHVMWLRKVLADPARQLLIGELQSQPVGVLRLDRAADRVAISVYLVPGNYGRGYGARLIESGASWVAENWPDIALLEAVVKEENGASIAAFSEAGFKRSMSNYTRRINTRT